MERKDELWEKVKRDFPSDPALQEVHYARLKIHEHTKNMSDQEYVEFIKMKARKVAGKKVQSFGTSPNANAV
ncbi:MAG: hypothetical protein ACE5MK_10040 [Acidobacteriota bacterium]